MFLVDSEVGFHRKALRLTGRRFPAIAAGAVGVDWVEFANGVWSTWDGGGEKSRALAN